ncbi:MAG: c-type cytochrome [Pirellulaceae bacterium]
MQRVPLIRRSLALATVVAAVILTSYGGALAADSVVRGYDHLINKAYLPPDFHQRTFDEVWRVWPEPMRGLAEQASPEERRRMAFERYGLTLRPDDDSGKPLQYVVDGDGNWTMNCFACHGGQVLGKAYPGRPNSDFDLETMTEEIRRTKIRQGATLTRMDLGQLVLPLGTTRGTSNAVMFGVGLMASRDARLNLVPPSVPPRMVHHDMEPPPWWHFRKRSHLYIDGFAEKGHRALMQFMLVPENGPKVFREGENDYRDVYQYLESICPPKYPFAIDRDLSQEGREVFQRQCAECHGTYGDRETYPELTVPIDEIGTDRVRYDALLPEHRRGYAGSWFADFGGRRVVIEPEGYVAPPLDGIWASAPYFHNGSVPTLWHVLHASQRPRVWIRQGDPDAYDTQRVGLSVRELAEIPAGTFDRVLRRQYFDTARRGKSAAGHAYPEQLTESEKEAVMEYLKTL